MNLNTKAGLTACVLSLFVIGCTGGGKAEGPTGEVEGSVMLQGKPLTEGSVQFYDEVGGNSFGAEMQADGTFKIEDPVPIGKYQVSFSPPDSPQPDDEKSGQQVVESILHEGYLEASTSGIVKEVKEGTNKFDIKLTKKGPRGYVAE